MEEAHGRWINNLQESLKVIWQDLELLEKGVSAFESEMAERAQTHRELKSEISQLRARLEVMKKGGESS